jgi:hypothetical protein
MGQYPYCIILGKQKKAEVNRAPSYFPVRLPGPNDASGERASMGRYRTSDLLYSYMQVLVAFGSKHNRQKIYVGGDDPDI